MGHKSSEDILDFPKESVQNTLASSVGASAHFRTIGIG